MNKVIIGVGSNIQPDKYILNVHHLISRDHHFIAESQFVETVPIGYVDQPNFINGAWLVETELNRNEFENYLKSLEIHLDRVRTSNKYGPRTIDLDVVVWNDVVVDEDVIQRSFLRKAVLSICPDLDLHKLAGFKRKRAS